MKGIIFLFTLITLFGGYIVYLHVHDRYYVLNNIKTPRGRIISIERIEKRKDFIPESVVIPLIGTPVFNPVCNSKKRYISGLYLDEGTKLYVNRGIGASGVLPVRLLSRPEVTVFEFI